MKNVKLILALSGMSFFPATSQAGLEIMLNDGLHSFLIAEGTAGDLSPLPGVETINQSMDNWVVNVVSSSSLGSSVITPALSLTSFNISYTGSGSALPLQIMLTDTGFGPTPGFFNLHVGGTENMNASVTSKFFYDSLNTPFAETNQIGLTQSFGALSYSNDQVAVGPGGTLLSPYSLTIETDITNVPGGYFTSQFTSALAAAVPLPGATPLLLSGLAFMGFFGRRNKTA